MDEFIMGLILFLIVGLFVILIIAFGEGDKIEKEMIAKCTPNPSLYECQLYLAKQGKSHNDGSMATGLATGLIVGQSTSRN